MDLLVDEQKQIFDVAVEDILKERGSAICLTDAPTYAERAVVSQISCGKRLTETSIQMSKVFKFLSPGPR